MESTPVYRATFIAVPPTDLPQATQSLDAAMQALTSRLRLMAAAAGLPDVTLSMLTMLRTHGGSLTRYTLLASKPGLEWSDAPVEASASTLDAVEISFLEVLAEYAFHQLDQVHELEPRLFGNQQLASTLALVKEAA